MATGMIGADTDQLRSLAGIYNGHAEHVQQAGRVAVQDVHNVVWEGPDATNFRQHFESEIAPLIDRLSRALEHNKTDLEKQADEQDQCSSGEGAPTLGGLIAQAAGAMWNGFKDAVARGWDVFQKLGKVAKILRWGMEAGFMAKFPEFAETFFKGGNNWAMLTGWTGKFDAAGKAIKDVLNLEDLAKAHIPHYEKVAKAVDTANLKFISEPLEKMLPQGWQHTISDTLGKTGRVAGKGLSAFGTVMDGIEAYNAAQSGNIWTGSDGNFTHGAAWNSVQAVAGAASFVPGPVGWVATGVSLGMAGTELVYNNWDSIKGFAQGAANVASSATSTVVDGARSLLNDLNPFR